MTQAESLSWGALNFSDGVVATEGYLVEAMADDTSMGNPTALVEVIRSLLTDGSLAVLRGWDNRQVSIRLRLSAPTATAGPALAAAESLLMSQVVATQPAPLVYVPPADSAETCVFDVVTAMLDRDTSEGWDLTEIRQEHRYFLLTLTCLPFARPETTTLATALPPPPASPTTVQIDACDVTTGWTRETNGSSATGPTDEGSNIAASAYLSMTSHYLRLVRTGAVSMGATPYLVVEVSKSQGWGGTGNWIANIDGLNYGPIVQEPVGATTKLYFQPPTSFTTLKIDFDVVTMDLPGPITLRVYDVSRTDTLAGQATTREQSRIIPVAGSAPTTAELRVWDANPFSLGADILVHTSSNIDWQPPLRRWKFDSAGVTADTANRISGSYNTLATPMTFHIPADLFTEGTYALMANILCSTAGTLTWTASTLSEGGVNTVGSTISVSGSAQIATTGGNYQIVSLGALQLPVIAVEGTQKIKLVLSGTANMTIDEGWLFGLDDGALTWIKDPNAVSAYPLTWIEIRSPELGAARPAVFGGTGAKGNQPTCIDYWCESFGVHRFKPGDMQVFTVTSATKTSQSEIEHYRRYHSHVEDE